MTQFYPIFLTYLIMLNPQKILRLNLRLMTLYILDIILHGTNNNIRMQVYRKFTNQNDLINFYCHHCNRIKSGIIIGFYLRTLRICSLQYLPEKEIYIETLPKTSNIIITSSARLRGKYTTTKSVMTLTTTVIINQIKIHIILPTNYLHLHKKK